jgi:5,10-methylenetetrahydromethanopterin reductase
MREYVEVIRRLFSMETVTFEGNTVQVRDLYLDLGHGVPRRPKQIPIMIGATGFQMVELAAEIADGVILNFFVSPEYNRTALVHIRSGAKKASRSLAQIDRPQLIACSLREDADDALDEVRPMVTMYLGQQPHIMKASGLKQSYIDEVNHTLGGWPPKPGGLKRAMELVDDKVVRLLTASGTPEDCRRKVREYVRTGCTSPMICPIGDNIKQIIDEFAGGYS